MDATTLACIDNTIYDRHSDLWWGDTGFASLLQHVSNPWRVPYFQRILAREQMLEPGGKRLLDVGCGGGVLAEELAAMGFQVTGIDPSEQSIAAARSHAHAKGLRIDYQTGSGERLPFGDGTFDVVSCCDVLEHIHGWDTVIAHVSRVLRPGGIFIYDTINRTMISKVVFIKLAQECTFTRFLPPRLHAWDMFIKPEELSGSLNRHGLRNVEIRGTKPPGNPVRMLMAMRNYGKGRITASEFGKQVGGSAEGPNIDINYMGHAIKPERPEADNPC
jgi:2-polyprenyl-6-hydroxyphenyl methylase/3-demethylubiquinone-9 3-methyltransferase